MNDEQQERPRARITRVHDQDGPRRRLRIEWPPEGATAMTAHRRGFTVVYHSDGEILREIELPGGEIHTELQKVERGVRYARPAGTRQRVINLSGHALEADKDEDEPSDNPDDTTLEVGPRQRETSGAQRHRA